MIKFHTKQITSNTQTNRSRKTTTKREQPHRRHCLPLLHVYTYRLAHLRPLYLSGAPEAAARLRKPATTVIAHHHSAAHDGGARRGAPPRGQARRRAPLFRRCWQAWVAGHGCLLDGFWVLIGAVFCFWQVRTLSHVASTFSWKKICIVSNRSSFFSVLKNQFVYVVGLNCVRINNALK